MIKHIFFPDSITMFFWGTVITLMSTVTAIHVLMNKREEPVSSVLWIFVIYTFPIAGIIIYLFFGINKAHTMGQRIKFSTELIKNAKKSCLHAVLKTYTEELKKYAHKSENGWEYPLYDKMLDKLLPESIPLNGNSVKLLVDGTKAYPKMLEEISKAEHSIHLQSFIIMDDEVGREIFNLLEQKSREGVKIKVIYDRIGSLKAGSKLFRMGNENFAIKPFSFLNLTRPWAIQLRNHRKLMVIDGKKAFIGGINISKDNDAKKARKDKYIHDLHCLIQGPAVGELQFAFLTDWYYVSHDKIEDLFHKDNFPPLTAHGHSIIRVVPSGPGQCDHGTEKLFTSAIFSAQKQLWIMTPYFAPDIHIWKMLCAAATKGVDIRLIIPEKNNHWYVQYATENLFMPLLEAGVRIFLKKGAFLHAKALLVDNAWAIMGSSNWDVRSFKLNYELDFVVAGGDFPAQLHDQFQKEFQESDEIFYADAVNTPLHREVLRRACSLLTPIL